MPHDHINRLVGGAEDMLAQLRRALGDELTQADAAVFHVRLVHEDERPLELYRSAHLQKAGPREEIALGEEEQDAV